MPNFSTVYNPCAYQPYSFNKAVQTAEDVANRRGGISGLIRLLIDGHPNASSVIHWLIRRLGKTAIPDLEKELENPNPQARLAALSLLSWYDEKPIQKIERLLDDQASAVRAAAIDILARPSSDHMKNTLFTILQNDHEQEVCAAAIDALTRTTVDNAIKNLIEVLILNPDSMVRNQTIYSLTSMGEEAIPQLLAALQTEDVNVRIAILNVLVHIISQIEGSILDLLKPPLSPIKYRLPPGLAHPENHINTEGEIRAKPGEELVQEKRGLIKQTIDSIHPFLLLDDPDASVRATAAYILGEQKIEESTDIEGLVKLLGDQTRLSKENEDVFTRWENDDRVCDIAASALGKIGSPSAIQELKIAFQEGDTRLRVAVIRNIGQRHDTYESAIPKENLNFNDTLLIELLTEALFDDNHIVDRYVWFGVEEQAVTSPSRLALETLMELRTETAINGIVRGLQEGDVHLKLRILKFIHYKNNWLASGETLFVPSQYAKLVEELNKLSKNKDDEIRTAALAAMSNSSSEELPTPPVAAPRRDENEVS